MTFDQIWDQLVRKKPKLNASDSIVEFTSRAICVDYSARCMSKVKRPFRVSHQKARFLSSWAAHDERE